MIGYIWLLLHFERRCVNVRNLKKIVFLLISTCFLFTSCSKINDISKVLTDEDLLLNETFSQIIDAIQNKDEPSLIAMFSQNAQNNDTEMHSEILVLFDLFCNKSISFDSDPGQKSSRYYYGEMRRVISSTFTVYVDTQTYYVDMQLCTVDSFDRQEEGIIYISVINSENWENNYTYHSSNNDYGIHIIN